MQYETVVEIAEKLGTQVGDINFRDPNVFYREHDSGKSAEELAFRKAVRFECDGMQAIIRGNGLYLTLEFKVQLNADTWSVNEPDHITMGRSMHNISSNLVIFTSGPVLSSEIIMVTHHQSFRRILEELDLGLRESLHFYKNGIMYYATTADASKFLSRTNALCQFVSKMATRSQKRKSQRIDLPVPFADLIDCAQEWAIGDDSERADALEAASVEDLTNLIQLVAPRLPSINAYLSTHSSENDTALSSLAETVSEAQRALPRQITRENN